MATETVKGSISKNLPDVIHSVGYGHLAPSTFGGRMFCMVFALLGIPLNLMVLKHIGDRINEFIHWCHYKIETKICKRDVTVLKTKTLLWSAALMVIMLLLGGVLYSQSEDWRFLDAVYYCFITFSTIGFGDLVPNQGEKHEIVFRYLLLLHYIFYHRFRGLGTEQR